MTYEEAIELAKDALCRDQDMRQGPNPYIAIQSVADALVHAYNCGRGSVTVQPCDCAAVVALRTEVDALRADAELQAFEANLKIHRLEETNKFMREEHGALDADAALGRLVRAMPLGSSLTRRELFYDAQNSPCTWTCISCTGDKVSEETPEAALLAAGVVATEEDT